MMSTNTVITIPALNQSEKVIRTAAYCRVSSNSDDQLHSFAAQVKRYTTAFKNDEKVELVDIYADEGITGTKTASRDDFNRLIADCRKGKIDRIVTKSLSRFARNNVDSIRYARELKDYGVSILFEKENIDTAYMSSELLLAISGAQAQEESISISKNMKWSIHNRMKNGTFIAGSTPYGYSLENGEFIIVEEEAEIVKYIFNSYLSGVGKKEIADTLNKRKIPTRHNYPEWRIYTVNYILTNERYIGDALLQKKYNTDSLPFRHKLNYGEKQQYYVENTNPPIISKEEFIAAQERINVEKSGNKRVIKEYPLRKMITCKCGRYYKSILTNGKRYWDCTLHNSDSSKCNARRIPEKDIYEAFITMINKLRIIHSDILPPAIRQIEQVNIKHGGIGKKIREIDTEIASLNNKSLVLARLNSKGIMRPDEYRIKCNEINSRVNEIRKQRRLLLQEQDEDNTLSGLRYLNSVLSNLDKAITDFDEELFKDIVEKITAPTHTSICFHLCGNLKITESIPEQKRGNRKCN